VEIVKDDKHSPFGETGTLSVVCSWARRKTIQTLAPWLIVGTSQRHQTLHDETTNILTFIHTLVKWIRVRLSWSWSWLPYRPWYRERCSVEEERLRSCLRQRWIGREFLRREWRRRCIDQDRVLWQVGYGTLDG